LEHHELIRQMFSAKDVNIDLVAGIGSDDNRAFHAQQWPSVVNLVRGGPANEFDFYFDHVVDIGYRLLDAMGIRYSKPAG